MENILVVKLSAIGDVIHALPVSYAIKEQYPNAHLTWVVEPAAYAILEDNPYIDELILFEKAKFRSFGGFLREIGPFRRRLRTRRYDASLDLQGLFKSAAIAFNAGAKLRIGTANMREGAHLVSRPVRGTHAEGCARYASQSPFPNAMRWRQTRFLRARAYRRSGRLSPLPSVRTGRTSAGRQSTLLRSPIVSIMHITFPSSSAAAVWMKPLHRILWQRARSRL